jgi:diguanylate cyclase (GGDEF)-like protein
MPLFLFVENRYIIELNIVLIMSLIFWLGYQMNYSTDDLAKSNDDNIQLNKKLRAYNVSLEAEVQKRTSEIEHLVIHDRLTNAFNRYWFEKRVTQALEEIHSDEKHYVLAFLDLDKFKAVNDTAGHLAGDELLRNVTLLIKEMITKKDYFARLGGDEFAILFETDTKESIDNAVATCNKICQVINAYRFDWEGHAFQIGVSIGVVNATNDIQNLTELFRKADKACYGAKNAGRNRVVVYSETI